MTRVRTAALVLCALTIFGGGCTTARALLGGSSAKASGTRSQKDIAACEKMCEMAGDAEGKSGAVADCKKDCRS